MRLVVTRPEMTFVLAYREAHIRETFDLFWMFDDPENKDDGKGYVRIGGLIVQLHRGDPDRYYYRLCTFFANNDEAYRREEEWRTRTKAVVRLIWMGMRTVARHYTNIAEATRYGHYTTRDLHVYYKGLEYGTIESGVKHEV